jgi:hypothetical protein
MPKVDHEKPLTEAYWSRLGEGLLVPEFCAVEKDGERRAFRGLDGIVLLGEPARTVPKVKDGGGAERRALDLNGRDVVIIQRKATYLNPWLFGQALMSMDLIRARWRPSSLHSALVCAFDDPELRPYATCRDLSIHVIPSATQSKFRMSRLPGAAEIARARYQMPMIAPLRLTRRFSIEGILTPDARAVTQRRVTLHHAIAGQPVITIHSGTDKKGRAGLGMYIGGEVIMTQAILRQMGAEDIRSVIVAHRRDDLIEAILARYATYDLLAADGTNCGEAARNAERDSLPSGAALRH